MRKIFPGTNYRLTVLLCIFFYRPCMHLIQTTVGDRNMGLVWYSLVTYDIISAKILSFVSFLKNPYVHLCLGISKKVNFQAHVSVYSCFMEAIQQQYTWVCIKIAVSYKGVGYTFQEVTFWKQKMDVEWGINKYLSKVAHWGFHNNPDSKTP